MFKDMHKILQERETERFKLEKFTVGKDINIVLAAFRGIPLGDYISLIDKNSFESCVMSNTPMEKRTNKEIVKIAKGDVLIAGLGIGMILLPIMEKEEVTSVTVIEKYRDIIDIVGEQLPLNEKVKIIHGDIHTLKTNDRYDTIYIDIWNYINSDVYKEMVSLKDKLKHNLKNESSILKCWCEKEAKDNITL